MKPKIWFAAGIAALMLEGCSSVSYVMDNYHGVEKHDIVVPGDDEYRVFDKPEMGQMMVTSSLSASASQGFVKGLTLMSVDTTPPKPRFQKAAETYLASTGRSNCKITDGYVLISPQFEFKYLCPAAAKTAAR